MRSYLRVGLSVPLSGRFARVSGRSRGSHEQPHRFGTSGRASESDGLDLQAQLVVAPNDSVAISPLPAQRTQPAHGSLVWRFEGLGLGEARWILVCVDGSNKGACDSLPTHRQLLHRFPQTHRAYGEGRTKQITPEATWRAK